jgi:uncharacterized protein
VNEQRVKERGCEPAQATDQPSRVLAAQAVPDGIGSRLPSIVHAVFLGTEGLRPGWGLLAFVLVFYALVQAGFFVAAHLHLLRAHPLPGAEAGKPEGPESMLLVEALMGLSTLGATWVMAKLERRRMGSYGFGGGRKAGLFAAGFFWGVAFLGLLVGALWKAGLLAFEGRLLFGADVLRYGAVWVAGFLLVGWFEESLMRGYLQITLARGLASLYEMVLGAGERVLGLGIAAKGPDGSDAEARSGFETMVTERARAVGFWTAAVFISFLFGMSHGSNPGESPIGLVSAGLIGVVFCLSLWRTGSLWWAIGFHAAWDWAQSFVFGVADSGTMVKFHLLGTHPVGKVLLSGGATGPEGSVFILAVLALVGAVAFWTLPGRGTSSVPTEHGAVGR